MEPKEAYDLRRRLILQYQDKTSPSELLHCLGRYPYSQFWNSLEAREFLRQLIESESATAELRQHAERALAALNEARSQQAEKSAPESKPTAEPKGLTDGNQRVHFRPLDIAWRDARGSSGKLRYVAGCMAIDGGIDVLWDKADSVYLLKTKGKATRVWSQEPMEDVYYTEVKYDGRYLWIAANLSGQAAQLWVLDPLEEKLWQLTVDDGLPLYPPTLTPGNPISQSSVVRVGPLAPGEAIVAGSFGRSWLAKVRFDPSGKHAVNVFHEAREIPTRDDRQTWTSSAIFAPTYAITLGSKKQNGTNPLEQRVIIGGSPIHAYPLIVDPHKLTVDLYPREWYQRDGSDMFRGAVYFAGSTSSNHDKLGLAVADAASISPRLLFDGIQEGIVVMQDEMVNVVGKRWWRGRIADRKLDDFGAVPWYYRNHWALSGPADVYRWQSTDLRLLGLGRSNHYGLLASYHAKDPAIGATLAQVLFDASADLQNQLAGTDTGGTKRQPSVPNTNTDIGDAWQYLPHATKAAFSRDGKWFVTASVNEILLWSTHDLRPIRRFAGLPGIVQDVAISHDGTRVAACSSKNETIVWDAFTGESIQQFASYNLGFDRIDFLSDSRRVSTSGSADWVQIWDLQTNEPTRIETLKHVAGVLPDGKVVGRSSGFPGRLVAWDPVDHSTRELFRPCWGIPIAISPDGRHVATHEMEGYIEGAYRVIYRTRVWELASGQELEVDRTKSTLISPVTLGTVDLPGGAVAELSLRGTERQWHFRRREEHVR
jgi:hypothetical protein